MIATRGAKHGRDQGRVVARTRCAAALAWIAIAIPALGDAPRALGEWRGARWGMTVAEVVAAFPGEAAPLAAPERLADGNAVAAGIERHVVGSTAFRVRFVFEPAGKLALVSLRTDPKVYAGTDVFDATRAVLVRELGTPAEETRDDGLIEMRQVTWRGERGRVDLKSIPGVVVILHAAPSRQPAGPVPTPRPELVEPRVAPPTTH